MKTKEEIEQLADERYLKKTEGINDFSLKGYIISATKGGFVDGYSQCQEDNIEKIYTEVDMRRAMKYASEITNNKMKYIEDYINSLNKQD